MYLVDTNVISEARKGAKANPGVVDFFSGGQRHDCYLSVQTMGELRPGVENIRRRGDRSQAELLDAWLALISGDYAERVLGFDAECAQIWGYLMSPDPSHPVDKQIAAIALSYDLQVVTRNVRDFSGAGVKLLNPFT
ncbi:MAG: type II toxin-antitoxin system VapC family toxin [Duganella sp.]